MKRLLFILLFPIAFFSCSKTPVVSFNGCRESACTDLVLFEDGTFELNWSFPSSRNSTDYNYSGQFLVLDKKIMLYSDSSFDASGQKERLLDIAKNDWVYIENRGFRWVSNSFEPTIH